MMGAIAYVILFIPVVALGRFLETPLRLAEKLMDALIHQFFNLDIMSRALPLVLQGLQQDDPALPDRDPARPRRRAAVRAGLALRLADRALGHDRGDRFLPRSCRRWCC
jgi:hypothetical protein